MAITYIASATNDTGGSPLLEIDRPTGTVDNDVMIAIFGNGQTDGTMSVDTGWTEIGSVADDSYNNNFSWIGYKVASSETGDPYTFDYNGSSSNQTSGIISTFRGVVTSNPLDVSYSQGSHYFKAQNDTSPTPQPITTVVDGAFIITVLWVGDTSITSLGVPSGYTKAGQVIANNRHCALGYKEKSTAGLDTLGTWNLANGAGTEDAAMYTIAIRPTSDAATTSSEMVGSGVGVGIGVGIV